MTGIDFFASCKFDEVIVPLPVGHGVLVEENTSTYFCRVIFVQISFGLLPEAILASESWNAACCADSSTSHDGDIFAAIENFGGLLRCKLFWLVFVFSWIFKTITEHSY